MKILFWLSSGLDRRTPSEHLLVSVIEALYSQGHTVHILQKSTGGPLPQLPPSLQTLGVTTQCVRFAPPAKGNLLARYLAELKYVRSCKKHIRKGDGYGAVFLQSTNVAGFAVRLLKKRLADVPVTYNVQDIFPYNATFGGKLSEKGIAFRILAAIQRYAYRHCARVITISEDMRDLLVEDGTPPHKIACVYNWGYRDEPYRSDELDCAAARELLPKSFFNVVYAGNVGVMQNVEILIRAAELMRANGKILFHIIGDGAYKERLQREAEHKGLQNLRFHPMQSSDLAPSLYATADVNVIPLIKNGYRTALPSKTATCMACGKPIVFCIGKESRLAQKVGAEDGCFFVDSEDADALMATILHISAEGAKARPTSAFFAQELQKSTNSLKYASIILGCEVQR